MGNSIERERTPFRKWGDGFLHRVQAISGIGVLRASGMRAGAGLQRGGMVALTLLPLLGAAGCVSSSDSLLETGQSFASTPVMDETAMNVGSVDIPDSAANSDAGAQYRIASATSTAPFYAEDIPAADVVPEPAPRGAMGNPRLQEGVELAFAVEEDDLGQNAAIEPASTGTGTANAALVQTSPHVETRPKTLFDLLRERWQRKKVQANTTRLASLGSPPSLAVTQAPEDSAQQTGLARNSSLFGVDDDDHDAESGTVEVASAGAFGRLSPNGLRLQTEKVDAACLKPGLVRILKTAEQHFGNPVIVTSGFRSPKDNRRAGGARKSLHMQCMAADVQIEGVSKWDLAAYLRTVPGRGGVGTYCRTRSVHIDIGEERAWHYPCRRTTKRKS